MPFMEPFSFKAIRCYFGSNQCDQIGRFIGLWATLQSLWQQLICPHLPHSTAIFVKVSKSLIFLVKSFLGNFWRFFSGHTALGPTFHCFSFWCELCFLQSGKWPFNERQAKQFSSFGTFHYTVSSANLPSWHAFSSLTCCSLKKVAGSWTSFVWALTLTAIDAKTTSFKLCH